MKRNLLFVKILTAFFIRFKVLFATNFNHLTGLSRMLIEGFQGFSTLYHFICLNVTISFYNHLE